MRRSALRVEALEDRQLLTVTVDTLVDESDGSIVDGDVSLRDAIALAPAGDTINFSVSGTIVLDRGLGELIIDRPLTITGNGAPNNVIDAQQNSRIFNVTASAGDLTLAGLTLTGGRTAGVNLFDDAFSGGAVHFASSGTLRIQDSLISQNSTMGSRSRGGGIFANGNLELTRSVVSENATVGEEAWGGGIFAQSGATITDSSISENFTMGRRASGGGIATRELGAANELVLINSTVSGNSTVGELASGGGVYANGANVILTDTIVEDNSTSGASASGGGIFSFDDVALTDSFVDDNFTAGVNADGGGVHALGNVRLAGSEVTRNTVARGVGGGVYANGDTTVTDSTVNRNFSYSGSRGGGGVFAGGSVTLTRSTVSENGGRAGGGVYSEGDVAVTESTVSQNSARDTQGGGVFSGGHVELTNSTVSQNFAAGNGSFVGGGGGVFAVLSATATNSTIYRNLTTGFNAQGGGLYVQGSSLPTTIVIESSIIAGNRAEMSTHPDLFPGVSVFSPALTVSSSLIGNNGGTGLNATPPGASDANGNLIGTELNPLDPRLSGLANNGGPTLTHALLSDSPAIDSGSNPSGLTTDQRGMGFDRTSGFQADIGAYELGFETLVVTTAEDELDSVFDPADLSLREAVAIAETTPVPTEITFDPALTAAIDLSLVGATTLGPSALQVSSRVFISGDGNGVSIGRSAVVDNLRLFHVTDTGNLTFENITLSNGRALGGDGGTGSAGGGGGGVGLGGAILNDGSLTIASSTLTANQAVGGNGGNGSASAGNGGPGGEPNGGRNGGVLDGGFGGGGAGGTRSSTFGFGPAGNGGFGGGGGGGGSAFGTGGFGAGSGGASQTINAGGGGGGAGLGGAIFNRGGHVNLLGATLVGNLASGGNGGSGAGPADPGSDGTGLGGALFSQNGTVVIKTGALSDNTAEMGGGIYVLGGTTTLADASVSDNTGSGIHLADVSDVQINELTVENNTIDGVRIDRANTIAVTGGSFSDNGLHGLLVESAALVAIQGASFRNNDFSGVTLSDITQMAELRGVTVDANSATGLNLSTVTAATVDSSTFSNTRNGSGLNSFMTSLEVVNSTISGNTSATAAAGINAIIGGALTVRNSTITNNRVDSDGDGNGTGGGILALGPTPLLQSTIVAGNVRGAVGAELPDDLSGPFNSASDFNLIGSGDGSSGIVDGVANNQVGSSSSVINPLLGGLQDNGGPTPTHALLPNSLAIDTGSNPLNLPFDQRGAAREQGASTDVGAFETTGAMNAVPIADSQNVSTPEDMGLLITLSGDDGDPGVVQTLTFAIDRTPANGTLSGFNPATGEVTYTPNANYNGPDNFSFTVTDDDTAGGAALTSAPATVDISVTAVNDLPTADAQTVTLPQGTSIAIGLTGSDGDPEVVQTLTFSIATNPTNGTLSGFNPATGEVVYTPDANYNGPDSFSFTITDDTTAGGAALTSAPATVDISVTAANDVPIADPQNVSTPEDAALAITLTGDDGDPGVDQTLTFAIDRAPANGMLSGFNPATGEVTYTPNANYNGPDSFTFTATDDTTAGGAALTSAPATVDINVTAVNDLPTAEPQNVSTPEDTALAITLTGDDGDPGVDQTLTFAIDRAPANGTLSGFNSATGEVTYTPNANYNGPDSFSFTVTDDTTAGGAALTSAPATVDISVAAVNDLPTADAQTVTTPQGTSISIGLTGSDGDPDVVQTLTFSIATNPTNGTLSGFNPATGEVVYTPNANYNGPDSFSFTVTDDTTAGGAALTSAPATVDISVTAANDVPVAEPQNVSTPEDTALAITLTGNDGDPGVDQTLTFAIDRAPANGTLSGLNPATGEVTYTPNADYNGPDSFSFTVTDDTTAGGAALTSPPATVDISVAAVNDVPTADAQTVNTPQGTAITIGLTGSDSDPEVVQTLTFSIATNPTNGTLSGFNPATGEVVYTPNANYNGPDSFSFTVTDDTTAGGAALTSAPATVDISVTAANDVPIAEPQNVSTPEDTALAVTLTGNDGDPGVDQTLTFAIDGAPANGTLSGFNPATGEVTYTPNANYNGPDSFSFTVTDDTTAGGAALTSAPATVDINVTAVNDAPTAPADADQESNVVAEGAAAGTSVGVIARSTDIDSATVSYRLANDAGGRFTIDPSSGTVSVAASAPLNGPATHIVAVEASDGEGGVAVSEFQITVNNVAPDLTVDLATVTVDEGQTANNSGTFSDPGLDAVSLSSSVGTVVAGSNGSWTWSLLTSDGPGDSQQVTITATDSDGLATAVTFDLIVNDVPPTTNPSTPPLEVTQVVVNDGLAQRSNIQRISIQFNQAANFPELIASGGIVDVVEIHGLTNLGGELALSADRFRWDGATHTLTIDLTVDGFGGSLQTLLTDDNYELQIAADRVFSAAAVDQALLDTDGVVDGIYRTAFHRLAGDANGDRLVNILDLSLVLSRLGTSERNADVDGDGDVDADDLRFVSGLFGRTV